MVQVKEVHQKVRHCLDIICLCHNSTFCPRTYIATNLHFTRERSTLGESSQFFHVIFIIDQNIPYRRIWLVVLFPYLCESLRCVPLYPEHQRVRTSTELPSTSLRTGVEEKWEIFNAKDGGRGFN